MDRATGAFEIRGLRLDEVRALYANRLARDFPADELKPLSAIEAALAGGGYACCAAVDGEAILAYAFFVVLEQWTLVDYYAVREDLRDCGIGSRFIRALVAGPLKGMACALLEVEEPECARNAKERRLRERRLAFYLRNGLRQTGVTASVWHVPYRILELPLGEPLPAERIRSIYAALYRSMMPKAVFDAMVEIPLSAKTP